MDAETEKAIEERMTRWRMSARCVCAACYMRAYQDAKDSYEGLARLKAWGESPEGKKVLEEIRKDLKAAGLVE